MQVATGMQLALGQNTVHIVAQLHTVPGDGCQREACAAGLSSCQPLQGGLCGTS